MGSIQIATQLKRGRVVASITVHTELLTCEQLTTVRHLLPLDRKLGVPILEGPGKDARHAECTYVDEHGEIKPVSFSFDVPTSANDLDGPALLDKWYARLKEERAKRSMRAKKRLERQAKALAEKKAAPADQQPDLEASNGAGGDVSEPLEAPTGVADLDGGELDSTEPPLRSAEPEAEQLQAPSQSVEKPRALAPDDLRSLGWKLPLLSDYEVGPVVLPHSVLLAGESEAGPLLVRSAVLQVQEFGIKGYKARTIVEDLEASLGDAWVGREGHPDWPETSEDLGLRLGQALDHLKQHWEHYREVLKALGVRASRRRSELGLADLVDLARLIRVDMMAMDAALAELVAVRDFKPSWVASLELAFGRVACVARPLTHTADLEAVVRAFGSWAAEVGSVEKAAPITQQVLFSDDAAGNRWKGLEAKVRRARSWSAQLALDPAAATAAVAVLLLL